MSSVAIRKRKAQMLLYSLEESYEAVLAALDLREPVSPEELKSRFSVWLDEIQSGRAEAKRVIDEEDAHERFLDRLYRGD